MNRILGCAAVLVLFLCTNMDPVLAAIGASGGGGPNTTTEHLGNQSGFTIVEDVFHTPTAGPWKKLLRLFGTGGGINSGKQVPLHEEFTNTGTRAWTDWHEAVTGPIEDFGFGPATDFAFERESVTVARNGVALVQGVDYTLTFTEHPIFQPNMPGGVDPGRHWQSISLVFSPTKLIQPSDRLTIDKNIFETQLNATPWNMFLIAEISQYPTGPEPAAMVMAAIAGLCLLVRRQRG
jgi:hypothetical protein